MSSYSKTVLPVPSGTWTEGQVEEFARLCVGVWDYTRLELLLGDLPDLDDDIYEVLQVELGEANPQGSLYLSAADYPQELAEPIVRKSITEALAKAAEKVWYSRQAQTDHHISLTCPCGCKVATTYFIISQPEWVANDVYGDSLKLLETFDFISWFRSDLEHLGSLAEEGS